MENNLLNWEGNIGQSINKKGEKIKKKLAQMLSLNLVIIYQSNIAKIQP